MQNNTVKQHIINETLDRKITCENSNYSFNKNNLLIYKNTFDKCKDKGVIVNCGFEDNLWLLKDLKTNVTTEIGFNLELEKDLMLALKFIVLDELKRGISNPTLQRIVRNIINTYMDSNGYSESSFDDYKDIFNAYGHRKKEDIIIKNLQFNDFYKEYIPRIYIDFFKETELIQRQIRTLPNYESVITFDFVLNDFITNCKPELKKKYLPIFLWWKITTIIPMRPTEFLELKSNCAFIKNNKYWIRVPRKKQQGNSLNVEVTNVIRTNDEIYKLVNEYLDTLTDEEKSDYLFSYKAYNSFIKDERLRKGALSRRNRIDKIDNDQLYELIDDFYTNVVEIDYGYKEIERVSPGDTRHFAFCNMMLQGFNMLTIARMGGHVNLKSQVTYCSHLDYFAEARIKVLSDQIKKNRFNNLGDTYLDENNALIIRSKLYINDGSGIKIGDNFCLDTEFPDNCIKDCTLCPYYVLDLSKPNVIKELKLKSGKINNNIKEIIKTMQKITTEMVYDLANISYSQTDQEQLFNLANKLNKLFNDKAIIDSYINNKEDN